MRNGAREGLTFSVNRRINFFAKAPLHRGKRLFTWIPARIAGSRITDFVSLGVIAKSFPLDRVRAVLASTGKASVR